MINLRGRGSDRDLMRSWERSHEAKKLTIFRSEKSYHDGQQLRMRRPGKVYRVGGARK